MIIIVILLVLFNYCFQLNETSWLEISAPVKKKGEDDTKDKGALPTKDKGAQRRLYYGIFCATLIAWQ